MSTNKFHCRKINGGPEFFITEWNDVYNGLVISGASEKKMQTILNPPQCKKQCFDCIADVGERRIKTQKIIELWN